jgi:hypothetical protein
MSRKRLVIVEWEVTDDLDGSPDAEPVVFGWGAQRYEIDLSKENAETLAQFLTPYMEAGRKINRKPRAKSAAASPTKPVVPGTLRVRGISFSREWVSSILDEAPRSSSGRIRRGHGIEVSAREWAEQTGIPQPHSDETGRVSRDVLRAFRDACESDYRGA